MKAWEESGGEAGRYGNWTMTHTGKKFWPLDPRPEDVAIEDIAHALSHICRYGGHCNYFYSVAEHSVLMASKVSDRNKIWALLHDATEAYLMDLPRPIKPYLPGYAEYEAKLMKCIAERYTLSPEMPDEVKDADNRIILDEMSQNMSYVPDKYKVLEPLGVNLQYWSPNVAKRMFMDAVDEAITIHSNILWKETPQIMVEKLRQEPNTGPSWMSKNADMLRKAYDITKVQDHPAPRGDVFELKGLKDNTPPSEEVWKLVKK